MLAATASRDAPETIGRYAILGQLATGGMAEILLARLVGPGGFERPLVIKRILSHLARQKTFVDMFVDEARIAARIRHANVVQVHELGQEADELFLAMEYVEGESLGGLMRRMWTRDESLGYVLSAYVIAEACAGLHAAHELVDDDGKTLELVHRDVSPQNVMVTYTGRVVVLDFGIAKAADRTTRTEAGQVKGKFEYMSPEQCRGGALDRRSDLFSLGTLLYELSTSRRLFKRANELATLKAICEQRIAVPSRFTADFPPQLERICLRALEKHPDMRYASAAEMRRDLLAALHDLGAGAMHEEELSHRMQDLFRDRIADKQDMLRRFRAGVSLTSVPAAETDATVDIPISFRDDGSVVDTSPATPARRASRFDHASSSSQDLRQEQDDPAQARTSRLPRAKWALAALAIGAAVSIGAAASGRFGPPAEAASGPMGEASETSPRQASRQASPSSPGEADPPAPPQSEPDVEHIVVHVESSPGGARVRIDGRDEGVTPLDLRLPRGKGGLKLELRREGFVTYTQSVVPDVDQKLLLSLRAVRGSGALPAAKPAAPAAPAKSGFRRFD